MQHLSHFNRARRERFELADPDYAGISGHYQMVLELRGGIQREAYETGKLLSGFLAGAFDNVRWDRHRCPNDLIAERGVVGTSDPGCDTVDTQRK